MAPAKMEKGNFISPEGMVEEGHLSLEQLSISEGGTEPHKMRVQIDVKVQSVASTPRSFAAAPSPSGHLGSLSFDQLKKLYALWGMLVEYLQRPYDRQEAKRDKQLVAQMYQQSVQVASSVSSLADSVKSETSASRSSAIQNNPLAAEFWSQAATDDLDVLLLRFLRARKWNVNEAFEMLVAAIRWRHAFEVRKLVLEGESGLKQELLESGKSFFWKTDVNGRTIW